MLRIFKERSIAKLNLFSLLIIIALLSLGMGYLFISGYSEVFQNELEKVEKDYLFLRKERIKNIVNLKIGDIENKNSRVTDILKKQLNKQVVAAHNIASVIYHTYKSTKTLPAVRALVKEAIQSIRHKKGEGYLLLCGNLQKIIICPSTDIFNELRFVDYPKIKGKNIIRKITRRTKTIGETYLLFKGASKDGSEDGIFFVKRFDVFNWFIGSLGRYKEVELSLKKEVLEDFRNISKNNQDSEAFEIYELIDGEKGKQSLKVLLNPNNRHLEGQELTVFFQDAKGIRYISKLINEINNKGNTFIQYWDIDRRSGSPKIKLTYYKLFPKWNWIIAKGFHIDSSDMLHMQRIMENLETNMQDKIKSAAGLFLFFILISILISIAFSKGIDNIFNNYKKEVEDRSLELAESNKHLNLEVSERKKVEETLRKSQEKLRRLASEVQLSEERERRRIAGDLHDSIGASLAISNLKLEVLSGKLNSPEYMSDLQVVQDNIKQVIRQTRSLTFQLSPPVLYQMGLEAALAGLAEQTEQLYDIQTEFHDDQRDKFLEEDVRIHIFRSARELLVNVIKHANASHVSISVSRVAHQIWIKICDDGVGFEINDQTISPEEGGKFGLFSIRERLRLLGGVLEINSKEGIGSTVIMKAPLKEKEKEVELIS